MEEKNEDILREVPEEYILDSFVMEDATEIVVIDPALYNGTVDEDALIMCKVVEENGENVLASLSEEEYNYAFDKYKELVELFEGEENE